MADWYLRPNTEKVSYQGDGTLPSEAAYEGGPGCYFGTLLKSMWPFSGSIAAGDTVWIIGTWDTGLSYQRSVDPIGAGTSGNPITIRGDVDGYNPAVVVNMAFKISSGSSWADMGDGTYRYSLASMSSTYTNMLEDIEDDLYRVSTLGECQSASGTFFYDSTSAFLYVNSVLGDPSAHNYNYGNIFACGINQNNHDLVFKNITLRGGSVRMLYSATGGDARIEFDGLNIRFSNQDAGIILDDSAYNPITYCTVKNCDIQYCKTGVYLFTGVGRTPQNNVDILDNYIANHGIKPCYASPADEHGIGLQGGHHIRVLRNFIDNCGESIAMYAYGGIDWHDNEIAYNIISNANDFGTHDGTGIFISTYNLTDSENNENNYYHHNLIYNCPVGFRAGCHDPDDPEHFYNNVIYGCESGVKLTRNTSATYNNQVELRNNIFANNTVHIDYASGSKDNYKLDSQYNCFAEDGASKFHHVMHSPYYFNYAGWQAIVEDGSGSTLIPDTTGSFVDDPEFVSSASSAASGYKVSAASPCIDTGTTVSATSDYFGGTIPSGSGYDIGFYELQQSAASTSASSLFALWKPVLFR